MSCAMENKVGMTKFETAMRDIMRMRLPNVAI